MALKPPHSQSPLTGFRSANVWDNAALERFISSPKAERAGRKAHRASAQAKADLFDCTECLHNPTRRHSPLRDVRPIDFETEAGVA